ncbi:unnamed protein product, partial [Candidula unifasciata]
MDLSFRKFSCTDASISKGAVKLPSNNRIPTDIDNIQDTEGSHMIEASQSSETAVPLLIVTVKQEVDDQDTSDSDIADETITIKMEMDDENTDDAEGEGGSVVDSIKEEVDDELPYRIINTEEDTPADVNSMGETTTHSKRGRKLVVKKEGE